MRGRVLTRFVPGGRLVPVLAEPGMLAEAQAGRRFGPATYDHFFSAALARLHEERRYLVFADLDRIAGRFPLAIHSFAASRLTEIHCSGTE
jgi:hypothetical protein